jgi:hypothetical protein
MQITLYVGPFTFVAPCAIIAGMFVRDVNPIVHLALSCFATGTFLYVGASEIVEEEFEGDMRSGRYGLCACLMRMRECVVAVDMRSGMWGRCTFVGADSVLNGHRQVQAQLPSGLVAWLMRGCLQSHTGMCTFSAERHIRWMWWGRVESSCASRAPAAPCGTSCMP